MTEMDRLIQLLARLPGLGPRSARRAVLHLIKRREILMEPLAQALSDAADAILVCGTCGNLDTVEPCGICMDETRSFKGRYHVLGGRLSALDGVGPEDLNIVGLVARAEAGDLREVILAMNLTVDGQTTAHYIADRLAETGVEVTRLAHGVPVGGELDYLDDGTLETALRSRRSVG